MSSYIPKFDSVFAWFSSDVILLISIFIVFLVFALYMGKGRIVSFILAFYPATFLYNTFPFVDKVVVLEGEKFILLNKLAIFLVIFIILNIVINRYVFTASEYTASDGLLRSGGLAFAALVLVVLFSYTTLNLDLMHDFSTSIDTVFTGPTKIFYWNLVPIILLGLI